MLSRGWLAFNQDLAINGCSVFSDTALLFPSYNIRLMRTERSLAASPLHLSSPQSHYLLSWGTIPQSFLIITASVTLWPLLTRVARLVSICLSPMILQSILSFPEEKAPLSLGWKIIFLWTPLQLFLWCSCVIPGSPPHVEWVSGFTVRKHKW